MTEMERHKRGQCGAWGRCGAWAALTLLAGALAGCTAGKSTVPPPPPSSPITSVTVTCSPSSILLTQTSTCSAVVAGTGSFNPGFTWGVNGGAITPQGVFTPGWTGTATITATSIEDTAISGSATVTITSPVAITSLSPASLPVNAAPQTLTINGSGFVAASTVTFNGVAHTATFVSASQLTIKLTAADLATSGNFPVVVTDPAPQAGTSAPFDFTVYTPNPAPSVSSFMPATLGEGSPAQTLTINGAGFLPSSTVTFNTAPHAATYGGPTQLTITLTAADLSTPGSYAVVVTNPAPGGGSSAPVYFAVTLVNPLPVVTGLSPASLYVGSSPQSMTITGTGFQPASTVTFGGVAHAAAYLGPTQLTITLTTGDLATVGTDPVVVTNPAPGGGSSTPVNFTVSPNPVPAVTSLTPNSLLVNSNAQALTISGTNFLPTSAVTFNGAAHAATYLSPTQLTILLTATDLATPGSFPVVVTNPAPGGGVSSAVDFTVTPNPVPSIASLSPIGGAVGAAGQSLTIYGSGFLSSSTVTYNGVAHTATYVSSTQLEITLNSSDLATAGNYAVVVTNPGPGGGSSAAVNFTVATPNPVPIITSLSPGFATAGAAPEALAIRGNNFVSSSTVTFNALAHTATYVSATELTIALTSADLATAGSYAVVVTNPAPAGGSSNTATFSVFTSSDTGVWAWMGGSSTVPAAGEGQPGVFGAAGDAANIPSGREFAASWTDSAGRFWLFGGQGTDSGANLGLLNDLWQFNPTANAWTWAGGSSLGEQDGVYGVADTPAPGNIPGARMGASTWTDSNGNLWLFGGSGNDSAGSFGALNDLWEFDTSLKQWAWVGGSSSVGATGGQPGVYGALLMPALANTPGGRYSAVSWTDANGNLWLFGGYGFDSVGIEGSLNDLWEFTPATPEWTWMGGSSTVPVAGGYAGVYGMETSPAAGNYPGSRSQASSWTDSKGNLWMFGGYGFDSAGAEGTLNDLWEFNAVSKEWAWMSGGNTLACAGCGASGVYATLDMPNPANVPGARTSASTWIDSSGNLWLFGGMGIDSTGKYGTLNDLWEFSPVSLEWTWMGGSSVLPAAGGEPGVYGTLATPAAANSPGSRSGANAWTDSGGYLWLFGGQGYDTNGVLGYLNDVWRLTP